MIAHRASDEERSDERAEDRQFAPRFRSHSSYLLFTRERTKQSLGFQQFHVTREFVDRTPVGVIFVRYVVATVKVIDPEPAVRRARSRENSAIKAHRSLQLVVVVGWVRNVRSHPSRKKGRGCGGCAGGWVRNARRHPSSKKGRNSREIIAERPREERR